MPVMSPFEGAKSENDEQQKALLDVIAQSGSAGRKEYENAQAQAQQQRQNALDYASQRARVSGQDFGPTVTAPVTEAADRFNTYFAGQNAAFQNNLQGIGNSAQSYLAKVNAIAPFIQAQNQQQAADRENQLKMSIAANQAKIDAAKAADERNFQQQLALKAAGGGGSSANVKPPSIQAVLGMAQDAVSASPGLQTEGAPGLPKTKILGGPRMQIGPATPGTNVAAIPAVRSNVNELATALGNAYGTPNIESIYSPQQQALQVGQYNRYEKATTPPPMPDEKWLMSNVPGMDRTKAQQALAAPEFVEAGRQVEAYFSHPDLDDTGKIADGSVYDGMSPYDAFHQYMFSQRGNLSMKEAAMKFYGSSLLR